ncbi:MAG: tRNA epoxyqueuosine(34) reductase QueG [Halobacteriovoraceae bacterium]|nr:tRNA epoxyqueuosine(34) reductase QueG [Halobacteriovoraceae bacterium]|tara:strand:+ start:1920 stop:2867 length:948 start_codon:yes stop_codon:yes gene_type:complete
MKILLNLNVEALSKKRVVDWGYTENLEAASFNHFEKWVAQGKHEPLKYLSDERKEKRKSLKSVFPKAQSALVFLFDYRAAKNYQENLDPQNKIAAYSIGFEDMDYHYWIKERLIEIATSLEIDHYDISLDVHPVLERDLAYRAGLGWFGKNSMLIHQNIGSYFLIGSLIVHKKLDLTQRHLETDHCGNCRRCIDACPTQAILENERTLDTKKCISTYTIEIFKEASAPTGYPNKSNEVFGCDICQEVCPWVKKNSGENRIDSSWLVEFFNRSQDEIYGEINSLSNREFKTKFKSTSLERLGKKGLLKNLKKANLG